MIRWSVVSVACYLLALVFAIYAFRHVSFFNFLMMSVVEDFFFTCFGKLGLTIIMLKKKVNDTSMSQFYCKYYQYRKCYFYINKKKFVFVHCIF